MPNDWAAQRQQMVEEQLRRRGIHAERVLAAMARIPREEFVQPQDQFVSYTDSPVSIGFGQTISQPYMTALMAQTLDLRGTETVLDVGTGSGYHAAVLGLLARRVYSIELVPELANEARGTLARTGLDQNVTVVQGDGSLGLSEYAPFQAITVGAAAPDVPYPLIDQLDDPGRLVIPVGDRADQDLKLVIKSEGRVEYMNISQCRFVPLLGKQGWKI